MALDSEDETCPNLDCTEPLPGDPVRDVLSGVEFCSIGCLLDDSRDVFELREGEA